MYRYISWMLVRIEIYRQTGFPGLKEIGYMMGFLLICLVAIVAGGIGYMLGRRAAERQYAMFPGQTPLQQRDGPQEYYRPYNNDGPGYGPQQQGYMAQQQGYAQ